MFKCTGIKSLSVVFLSGRFIAFIPKCKQIYPRSNDKLKKERFAIKELQYNTDQSKLLEFYYSVRLDKIKFTF